VRAAATPQVVADADSKRATIQVTAMPGIIGTAFDIRPGERSITFLMMLYHFLVLITLYLLKPARDSLSL
jgi:hypothetical protein